MRGWMEMLKLVRKEDGDGGDPERVIYTSTGSLEAPRPARWLLVRAIMAQTNSERPETRRQGSEEIAVEDREAWLLLERDALYSLSGTGTGRKLKPAASGPRYDQFRSSFQAVLDVSAGACGNWTARRGYLAAAQPDPSVANTAALD